MLEAYSYLINIFVNYHDVHRDAMCMFQKCTFSNQNYGCFTNSTKWLPAIFQVEEIILFFLCYKYFHQKTTGCTRTRGIFNGRPNNSIVIPVTWVTSDICYVNGTKHGSDIPIVRSYFTFPSPLYKWNTADTA